MTTEALLKTLRAEINEAKQSADSIPPAIHNSHTLWLAVSAREFFNELNFLDKLLTYPLEQIPTEFKARCALRQTNTNIFISFADHPATLTNRLYYKLAILIFKPANLQSLLSILMPNTTRCFRWEAAALKVGEMTLLSGVAITETALAECVFFDDAVFPLQINASATPSLQEYLELYRALNAYPALLQKLYAHNNDYKTLATHIRQANNIAPSPREMLLSLISSLRAGSSHVTGLDSANFSATLAIAQFFEYFHALPTAIQKTLNKLPSEIAELPTFGALFTVMVDKAIPYNNTCIEIGANNLTSALKLNNDNDVFDYRPKIDQETLDTLNAHYEKFTPSRTRETDDLIVLPFILLAHAFQQLIIDHAEVFLLLLKDLPPETYSALLQNMQLSTVPQAAQRVFDGLTQYCRDGLLNEEQQRAALLNALLSINEVKYRGIDLRPLSLALFNTLPMNLRLAMLGSNPSKAKYNTFCELLNKSIFNRSEPQEAAFSTLPPVIALEVSLENCHVSNLPNIELTPFFKNLSAESLRTLVFEPFAHLGEENSLIVKMLTNPSLRLGFAAFEELLVVLERMNINIPDFQDSQQKNLLHYVCEYDVEQNPFLIALCRTRLTVRMNNQADSAGLLPTNKVKHLSSFVEIFKAYPEHGRVFLLRDEPLQAHPVPAFDADINTQGLYYFHALVELPTEDQIPFLNCKTPSGQRVIDSLMQSTAVYDYIQAPLEHHIIRKAYDTLEWLLRLLTHKNLINVDELITTVLNQSSWDDIRSMLSALLKMQFIKSRYFVFPVDDYHSLFAFYKDVGFQLTKEDCYAGIVATRKRQPSLENIETLEGLLTRYFEVERVRLDNPISEEIQTVLNIVLEQSSIPSSNGGMLFNPVLLLLFHAKMKTHHYKATFSALSVTLGAPIHRTLTIGELIGEVLFYIPAELRTSPKLVLALYAAMTHSARHEISSFLTDNLGNVFDAPEGFNTRIEKALHQLNKLHGEIKFLNYAILIKKYFSILRFVEQHQGETSVLHAYFKETLLKYLPVHRLIFLNIRPHGASASLNELFGEFIKPVMSDIHQSPNLKIAPIATLEEYLQFTQIDWLHLLKLAITNADTTTIEHLLSTRLPQMQLLHQQHNLISLCFEKHEDISTRIIYLLQLFGFKITDSANLIPRQKLNDCLNAISVQVPFDGNIRQRQVLEKETLAFIDALVEAGADVNNTDRNNAPPLFRTRDTVIAERLISHGANVNFITSSGENILTRGIGLMTVEGNSVNSSMILLLLKHHLSPDILNQPTVINNRPATLLSVLLDKYSRSIPSITFNHELRAPIEAMINAGANPVYWHRTNFAFVRLTRMFPHNVKLLSFTSQQEVFAADKPTFELIAAEVRKAITGYDRAQSYFLTRTMKDEFLKYDSSNKFSYLSKVESLFDCASSLDLIHTALKGVINLFVDSEVEGIITVKRQPDLSTHKILFELIRAVYGEAQVPRVPPPIVSASSLNRYFVGKIPQTLFITNGITQLFTELHPDQFCTFNVYELLFSFHNIHTMPLKLDALSEEQICPLLDQFFLDAKKRRVGVRDCLCTPITGMRNTAYLVNFYQRLFKFAPLDEFEIALLPMLNQLPESHHHILFSVIPVNLRFEMLQPHKFKLIRAFVPALMGEDAFKKFSAYRQATDCVVSKPQKATAEGFAEWEVRIQALCETLVLNCRGDSVFHHAAHASSLLALIALFEKIPSLFDRITVLLMKNKEGESVLTILNNRPNANITNDITFLFAGGHPPSASLYHPFIKEICLQHPEFFLPLFRSMLAWPAELYKIECLHVRHRDVVLVDKALAFVYENNQCAVFDTFAQRYKDYFLLRAQLLMLHLLPEKPEKLSLFYAGYNTLVAENRERLKTLTAFTDERLFDNLDLVELDKMCKQRELRQ